MTYAKCRYQDSLFNYYAIDWSQEAVGIELVSFVGSTPSISYRAYDLRDTKDLIELDDLGNACIPIKEEEYQTARELASVNGLTEQRPPFTL